MLIKFLVILATIVLLSIGYFLITHTNKPFMLLHPENNPLLGKIISFFGIFFLILGLMAFIAIFFSIMLYITIIMVLSCIMLLVMELILLNFISKK